MKFTSIPAHFSPICEGLTFEFDTESEACDVVVEIFDTDEGSVIGEQRLFGVTNGKINIAPYVLHRVTATPTLHDYSTLEEAPIGRYAVRINGTTSPEVMVSTNHQRVQPGAILSTMPQRRTLAYGDSDQIALFTEPKRLIRVCAEADNGESLSLTYHTSSGAVLITLSTCDFKEDVRDIKLYILDEENEVAMMSYEVVAHAANSKQLAWRSKVGTVEQYRFVARHIVTRRLDRVQYSTSQGPTTSRCSSEQVVELVSNYESRAMAEALSEIVASPKVWIIDNRAASEVEIVTASAGAASSYAPDKVELEVRLWHREEVA